LLDSFFEEPPSPSLLCRRGLGRLLDEHSSDRSETDALSAEGFRMGESSLASASPASLALNLETLQDFLDRILGPIMTGEMLTVPGVSGGSGR
jgi:hypothetical protein